MNGCIYLVMMAAHLVYSTDKAIDYLDGTQNELNSPQEQKNGKEGHIPSNNVSWLLALRPPVLLQEVPVHIKLMIC